MTMPIGPVSQRVKTHARTDDGGYFVFSLDTELAWGDLWNQPGLQDAVRDGQRERAAISRLLDMMDEFGIVATWAVTGLLFYASCEECESCPVLQLQDSDRRFAKTWKTNESMWYGADIVDALLARSAGHEIGFHGYTHRTFDRLNREEARFEILEWQRLATRKGIAPKSVVFPQGRIRHLELFLESGFLCYRGAEVRHPALGIPLLGKVLNKINLKLAILPPQVFAANVDSLGLVNVPGSLWLFRTNRRVESLLDSLNLHILRLRPAGRSIKRAAQERKAIHFWIHPQELRTEKDFAKLRFIFERVAAQIKSGRLKSITMADLARRTLEDIERRHATRTSGDDEQ